jgi:hypothetical protein
MSCTYTSTNKENDPYDLLPFNNSGLTLEVGDLVDIKRSGVMIGGILPW